MGRHAKGVTAKAHASRSRSDAAGTLESIHFSKVLLAPDGQAAVIAYWYSCGNLCGNATLALLRKRPDGRWPIAVQKTLLIS